MDLSDARNLIRRVGGVGLAGLALVAMWAGRAGAHEPVFGLGTHTLYEGGWSTSLSYQQQGIAGGDDARQASLGVTYGLTADLNLAAGLPYVIHQPTPQGHVDGVGDPVLQVKWRPWKHLTPGNIDSFSVLGAVKLPAGDEGLSPGNTAYVLGAAVSRENLRYYLFASARYIAQSTGLRAKPGNAFLYDAATGIRPFIAEYDEPDLVVLVEFNGRTLQDAVSHDQDAGATATRALIRRGQPLSSDERVEYRTRRQAHSGGTTEVVGGTDSGGTELAVTPELLLSWGQVMLKGGVQFPFWDNFAAGAAANTDFRLKTDLIIQF